MFVLIQMSDYVTMSNVSKFVRTGFAKKLMGRVLAQPVIPGLEKRVIEDMKNPSKSFNPIRAFKNNFAWGDVFSLLGLGLLTGHHFLVPPDKNDSIIDKIFLWGTGLLSASGFIGARVGQAFGLHKQAVLKEDYWKYLVEDGERRTGKQILEPLDTTVLRENSTKKKDLLIYPISISSKIHQRHIKGQKLTGLFSGHYGTGKTEGVKLILGNWVSRVESENKKAKVLQLNADHLNKALEAVANDQLVNHEDLEGFGFSGFGNNIGNQTLMAFKYLIDRCKEEVAEAKKEGCELAVFIDEFEKVLDMKKLAGCDENQIKVTLTELNKLLEGEFDNLIVTSNKTKTELQAELSPVIDPGTLGALLARLHETVVPIPDANTQARTIATYVFSDLVGNQQIDINDFDFGLGEQKVNDTSGLEAVLLAHSQAHGNYLANGILAGRELEHFVHDLPGHLLELRRIAPEKKITLGCLRDKLNIAANAKGELYPDLVTNRQSKLEAITLMQNHIRNNAQAVLVYYEANKNNRGKIQPFEILKSIYKSADKNPDSLYTGSDDKNLDHGILLKGKSVKNSGKIPVVYHDRDFEGNPLDHISTVEIDSKELEAMVSIELGKILPKEKTFIDLINEVLNTSLTPEFASQVLVPALSAIAKV